MAQPEGIQAFHAWLQKNSPSDAMQLEFVMQAQQLDTLPPEQKAEMAGQMCTHFFGKQARETTAPTLCNSPPCDKATCTPIRILIRPLFCLPPPLPPSCMHLLPPPLPSLH